MNCVKITCENVTGYKSRDLNCEINCVKINELYRK